jgi:hypothetical protein
MISLYVSIYCVFLFIYLYSEVPFWSPHGPFNIIMFACALLLSVLCDIFVD